MSLQMTTWSYGSSMAGAMVKQGEKANKAGGVEGRLATQNDVDIMQYILTWDACTPSVMTTWPFLLFFPLHRNRQVPKWRARTYLRTARTWAGRNIVYL